MRRWIIRRAALVLLSMVGVVVVSLAQIVDLRTGQPLIKLDPSVDGMLPANDEIGGSHQPRSVANDDVVAGALGGEVADHRRRRSE